MGQDLEAQASALLRGMLASDPEAACLISLAEQTREIIAHHGGLERDRARALIHVLPCRRPALRLAVQERFPDAPFREAFLPCPFMRPAPNAAAIARFSLAPTPVQAVFLACMVARSRACPAARKEPPGEMKSAELLTPSACRLALRAIAACRRDRGVLALIAEARNGLLRAAGPPGAGMEIPGGHQ